jgi:cysteine desulfurase
VIYLDHNATTPLDPDALDAMLPFLRGQHGNASSVHSAGQAARHAVDEARESVAAALHCRPKDLVFTSGGTEANNLAIRGVFAAQKKTRQRVITSAVEHPSVLDTVRSLRDEGAEVVELPVSRSGELAWPDAITPETALVSVMWANNETGVLFPVEEIGARCRALGVPFHVDAVQAAGKVPIDLSTLPIDLLTVSAHKLYGPKGIGALFVRAKTPLWTVQTGGHQERGRRGGTENVAGIVGFGTAVTKIGVGADGIRALREAFEAGLRASLPDVVIAGSESPRVGNTTCALFPNINAEALLMALDLQGICGSSGSACTAGSLEPSHVIRAMGFGPTLTPGAIRFSFGRSNTEEEVRRTLEVVRSAVARLRAR